MKTSQILFLGIAAMAGAAAFLMSGGPKQQPKVVVAAPQPQFPTADVLVASQNIGIGTLVTANDMAWRKWPKQSLSPDLVVKASDPNGMTELSGSVARGSFIAGEPMIKEKLVKGPNSGFLSAILPSGYRAVAINIDAQGATTAGGFILPNDRVDVILTERDAAAEKAGLANTYTSRTILRDVRVLAIGQNVQQKGSKRVVIGSNATLEVTPRDAQLVVQAQRDGQLSLALRSMLNAKRSTQPDSDDDGSVQIVRFGVAEPVTN